jgi:limonene-1,2-epoxide hydrolase
MGTPVQETQNAGPLQHATGANDQVAKQNLTTVQNFFAAYTLGDATAMAAVLDPKTQYRDPSFGHLKGKDQVSKMWGLIAGGSTKVNVTVENVKMSRDGRTATASVVEAYSFLGNHIQNHITSTFTFGPNGQITSQKDTFSWKDWGKQTGALSPILQTPLGHAAVRVLLRAELLYKELGPVAAAARADLSGFPAEIRGALKAALEEIARLEQSQRDQLWQR